MSVYALYLHLKKLRVFTTVRGRYNMTSIAQLNKYMYATTVFIKIHQIVEIERTKRIVHQDCKTIHYW